MDPSPNTITIPPEIQAAITAALAAQAQVYEGTIARLENRMASMSLPKPPAPFETPPKSTKASSKPFNRYASEPPSSRKKDTTYPSPSTHTPNKSTKTPPISAKKTPAKKRPNQVQVEDYPKDFGGTKV